MEFGMNKKVAAIIALIISAIAGILFFFGLIPWWAALLSIPILTVAIIAGLLIFAVVTWMAGGSH
jgi:hypothetical protein